LASTSTAKSLNVAEELPNIPAWAPYPTVITLVLGKSVGKRSCGQNVPVSSSVQVCFRPPFRPWRKMILGSQRGAFISDSCRAYSAWRSKSSLFPGQWRIETPRSSVRARHSLSEITRLKPVFVIATHASSAGRCLSERYKRETKRSKSWCRWVCCSSQAVVPLLGVHDQCRDRDG
jgi:hypothetical protein